MYRMHHCLRMFFLQLGNMYWVILKLFVNINRVPEHGMTKINNQKRVFPEISAVRLRCWYDLRHKKISMKVFPWTAATIVSFFSFLRFFVELKSGYTKEFLINLTHNDENKSTSVTSMFKHTKVDIFIYIFG